MIDEQARKAELLVSLSRISRDDFDRRRLYEWRLAALIWTAMAAFAAIVVTSVSRPFLLWLLFGIPAFTIGVVAIPYYWLYHLGKANAIDQEIAIYYSNMALRLTGIPFPPKADSLIKILRKNGGDIARKLRSRYCWRLSFFIWSGLNGNYPS